MPTHNGKVVVNTDELMRPLARLIGEYGKRAGTDTAGAVRDVLTELMHHCDRLGLDFDEWLGVARDVYAEEVDDEMRNCECEHPGYFHSGLPGVLAHVVKNRLPRGASVERCDLCERYATDAEARKALLPHLAERRRATRKVAKPRKRGAK